MKDILFSSIFDQIVMSKIVWFCDQIWKPDGPIIKVEINFEENISFNVFGTFIESIYNNGIQMKINSSNIQQLHYLAKIFNFEVLKELIEGNLNFETLKKSDALVRQKNQLNFIYIKEKLQKSCNSILNGEFFDFEKTKGAIKIILQDGIIYSHK